MGKKVFIAVSILFLLLAISVSALYYTFRPGYVYRVYVDEEDIGTVYGFDEYEGILQELLAREEAAIGLNLDFAQELTARKEFQWNPQPEPVQVQDSIRPKVSFITVGWALVVNDETLLWTATREDAEELLNQVALHYFDASSTRELISANIVDGVEIRSEQVLPEDITMDQEFAVSYLLQGSEKVETYEVSKGDSVWSIARSANISQAQLKEANPLLPADNILKTGQVLNLVVAEPKINVKTVEKVLAYESIPFSTSRRSTSSLWYYQSRTAQSGKVGKREVTYEVDYLNGAEGARKIVGTKVDSQPIPRIVEQGTSKWPSGARGMFRWPLNTGSITDRFGSFQSWRTSRHRGVDIGAPAGTPIYAAASGTVVTSSYGSSYGNFVVIDHGNGYSTLYAHATTRLVREGQRVSKGEIIARVGSTGNSTGNHLHFEVRRNGTHIDPLQFFNP